MRFSIWPEASDDWPTLVSRVREAEAAGWDGVWIADHFMPNTPQASGDVNECFALLAALAVAVPRMRIGSLVAGNTYRHPAVLANQAATIDLISGGRFVLGMGAGWQRNEHEKFGIDLPPAPARLRRFEEALRIVRALRDEARASVAGEFYVVTDVPMAPKPVGPMPILVGGSGEQVMPGIVARHADEWNVWGDPERFAHKSRVMSAACEAIGRDPATLRRSTQALVYLGAGGAATAAKRNKVRAAIGGTTEQLIDTVGAYHEAGLDELIVPVGHLSEPRQVAELWSTIIEQVAPSFRN